MTRTSKFLFLYFQMTGPCGVDTPDEHPIAPLPIFTSNNGHTQTRMPAMGPMLHIFALVFELLDRFPRPNLQIA